LYLVNFHKTLVFLIGPISIVRAPPYPITL